LRLLVLAPAVPSQLNAKSVRCTMKSERSLGAEPAEVRRRVVRKILEKTEW